MSATIGTKLHTWLYGRFVGRDEFGNRYFEHKQLRKGEPAKRRWVVYNGLAEASKVPAAWHGWLHYVTDELPQEADAKLPYSWGKKHVPNLTGTSLAYKPPGHADAGGKRAKATGDYEAWQPK